MSPFPLSVGIWSDIYTTTAKMNTVHHFPTFLCFSGLILSRLSSQMKTQSTHESLPTYVTWTNKSLKYCPNVKEKEKQLFYFGHL